MVQRWLAMREFARTIIMTFQLVIVQVVFNSAIQRVTSAKDAEIERLKQQMMTSSVTLAAPDPNVVTSSARIKDREKIVVAK